MFEEVQKREFWEYYNVAGYWIGNLNSAGFT